MNISVNTENKDFEVKINGMIVPNVVDVSCYRYLDDDGNAVDFYVRLETKESVSEDISKRVVYYSSASQKANELKQSGKYLTSKNLPDFIGEEAKSQVHQDIEKFFAQKT
jgi:hypothetical protein